MAYNNIISTKAWRSLPIVLLGAVLVLFEYSSVVHGEPQVPCFFIFGDSLADNGNNNFLLTLAKANFSPYGIDFPGGATGRFTNNRTTVDLIAELLGFPRFIPPFATTIVTGDVTSGVNYASTSAGIRDETGKNLGDNISFNRQLQNHRITMARLTQLFGSTTVATNLLNKCLYSVGLGNNDYLNNYFLPVSPTSNLFTPEQYATALITQYSTQLRTLYGLGARKMVLNGVGQIGCIPYAISRYGTNMSGCVEKFNEAVQLFNARLLSLVDQLNNDLTDATFIYINTYGMLSNLPAAGFRVINKACCPTQIGWACVRDGIPCQNRNEYVFYDEFHPTDAANRIAATRSYTASAPSDAYPFDISHLVAL